MPHRPPITILDGGMSRELVRIEAPFRQPEWSAYALMQAPHTVKQVHENFARAGADILTTNTYALVPFHIGEDCFRDRAEELAGLAGRLVREAADEEYARSGRTIKVAGSLPPIFGSYEPELYDDSKVQDYLSVLVRSLSPYVDVWLGETLSLVAEVEAVREAVAETGKPFWISFTISDREVKESAYLRGGESVVEATRWAMASGAEALLFNCSRPEFMATAIMDAKAAMADQNVNLPIGVYANAFVQNPEGYAANKDYSAVRDDLDAQRYSSLAHSWMEQGAPIIGGCCGIGCNHIQALARDLKGNMQ